ncbi:MAG: hypothetical protein QNK11_02240 [Legionella sp.]|nr:hypothetical protein [Legionella sp.]
MLEWGVLIALAILGLSIGLYPLRQKKILFFALIPAVAVFLVVGYAVWGGGLAWQAFQVAEAKKREAKQVIEALGSVDVVIERLKSRLSETPKDAKAWFLLGRVYASTGDWQHAHEAYLVSHGLALNNHEYTLHYAQSVWELNHQAFDDKTRALLTQILADNPKQPDALAMLAYDAYARHLNQEAVAYWERLLALTDASTEEAGKLRQAIAKAR